MIDPRSLAALLSHHPDAPCRVVHEIAAEPLASLPALMVLAGQLPRSATSTAGPGEAFAPVNVPSAASVIHGIGQRDVTVRLKLDRMPADDDEALARLGRLLTSTLSPHADGFRLAPPHIFILGPGAAPASLPPGPARLMLTLRGAPAVRHADEATGGIKDEAMGLTPEGEGLFVPGGTPLRLRNGQLVAVQLVFPWETRQTSSETAGQRRRLLRFGEARRFFSLRHRRRR